MNNDNILIIIQARRASTRLEDKILLPLCERELLLRMVERVRASRYGKNIVIATTKNKRDDLIVEMCKNENIKYFRGDEYDVLDRHYHASLFFEAEIISKIPSDCPLIDPKIIDRVFDFFLRNYPDFDYVSNLHPATYPDGNDVEIFKVSSLEKAWKNSRKYFEREHTTPYIWDNPALFNIGNVLWEKGLDYSMTHRFTIDYPEDYELLKIIFEELYPENPFFGLEDILELVDKKKPELKEINKKYLGVNWYRNHLDNLKTVTPEQTKIL